MDIAAEGPFQPGRKSSYLINYRYSTLGILDKIGLEIQDENESNIFQDLSFKFNFPTVLGTFSLFGLGGISSFKEEFPSLLDQEDYNMGVVGITNQFSINDNTFVRSVFALSGTELVDDFIRFNNGFKNITRFTKSYKRGSVTINKKLNASHIVETGATFSNVSFNFKESFENPSNTLPFQQLDFFNDKGKSDIIQGFVSWKFRINQDLSLVNGMHWLYFGLNNESSFEPRSSIKWQFRPDQSVFAGFGLHSKIESLEYYFGNFINADGTTTDHNRELGITKARHFVLGYDRQFNSRIYMKAEIYYQKLFNVPVLASSQNNSFSSINLSEGYVSRPLVNNGSGENYGIELSVERKFFNNYYFLANASFYESKYKASDGVKRNSRFSGNYSYHILGGKEINVGKNGKNNILGINLKGAFSGNKRHTPIDISQSRLLGTEIRPVTDTFAQRYQNYFRLDFQISFRKNKPNSTSEWRLDIQNLTNRINVLEDFYNSSTMNIVMEEQNGLIPLLSYRIEF